MHGEQFDRCSLYWLGLLSEQEARQVEEEAALDEEFAAALQASQEVTARLGFLAPEDRPRGAVKEKLLASIRKKARRGITFVEEEPGVRVHRGSGEEWTPTPFPGVHVKQVYFDPATGIGSVMIRLAAGAKYPNHTHSADEQCYVIAGDVHIGNLRMKAGDYSVAVAGTRHGPVETDGGCVLFIVGSMRDEIHV